MSQSEVAQLRETITLENEAAYLGLSGLASGISRHDFIEARMHQASERLLQLAKEGNIEQYEKEVELMQVEILTCHTMTH